MLLEKDECKVNEQGTGVRWPCQFPFVFQSKTFTSCTNLADPDEKLWCSTRVDPDTRQHITGRGFWGYCTDDACKDEGNTKEDKDEEKGEIKVEPDNIQCFLKHHYWSNVQKN